MKFLSKYLPAFQKWNLCFCLSDSNSVHYSSSTVKKKIVMKVQFSSEKRRTEAFKIAAGFRGVSNVSVEAEEDQIVVIGVGIDSVCLAKSLRKKLNDYAQIVSVEEVKKPEEKKPEVEVINPIQWTSSSYVQYPMQYCDVVYSW